MHPAQLLMSAPFALCALAAPPSAQCQWKKPDAGPAGEAYLGYAVAVDGDTLVVGAPGTYMDETAGAAYVFPAHGLWTAPLATLRPSTGALGDDFGAAVAVDGDTIVVGAPFHADARGAAYVFERFGDVWVETQELAATDGAKSHYFGRSVDVDGERIAIGASSADGVGEHTGAAYVFVREPGGSLGWALETKLFAFDGEEYDLFGWSIAVDGDRVVVGASQESELAHWAGAAYAFRRDGVSPVWHQQKLVAADGALGDFFGHDVGASSGSIVVSSNTDNGPAGSNQGSAYVFVEDQGAWVQQAKLTAHDAASWVFFGESVDIDGDRIAVGSMWDAGGADKAGAVYVFERDGVDWTEASKLLASDAAYEDQLGAAVAIQGSSVVAGAYRKDGYQGAAYLFDLDRGLAWTSCAGAPAQLSVSGSLAAGDGDFELVATGCPPGTAALFFCGLVETALPTAGGLLCIHPDRMGPWAPWPPVEVDAYGIARIAVDLGALVELRSLLQDAWYFQLAYLDRAPGGAGFGLSDGLGVRFCP